MKDILFNHLIKVAVPSLAIASIVFFQSARVSAHGKIAMHEGRIYNCYSNELDSAQALVCDTQIVIGEPSGIDHSLELTHIEASGNHQDIIFDGKLCSTDIERLKNINILRSDFIPIMLTSNLKRLLPFDKTTHICDGTSYFEFYVNKDSSDATQSEKWNDLVNYSCCKAEYATSNCGIPDNKAGLQLIYGIRQLAASSENLYHCSDGPTRQSIDSYVKKFHWNFAAGNTLFNDNHSHLYPQSDELLALLTITDNSDATNTPNTKAVVGSDTLSISSELNHLSGGSIDACDGINTYPNWTQTDWSGIPDHANARDLMQHSGSAYKANWYTKAIPGSDASWSFVHSCNKPYTDNQPA